MGFVAKFATKFTVMALKPIDRIVLFIDYLKESQKVKSVAEFERICGFGYGFISNQKRGAGWMNVNMLNVISSVYPELNIDWVVTGRGVMLYNDLCTHYQAAYEAASHQIDILNKIIAENKKGQKILP